MLAATRIAGCQEPSENHPVKVLFIMAARVVFEERRVILALIGVDPSAGQIAEAFGRHPSTVRRKSNRVGARDAYRPEKDQAETERRARARRG